jgi:glycosyltransferase involved in cell wall biosynthesis
MKSETIFVTNIPAPYRIEFYNTLSEKNLDFEVWYMQQEVSYRPGWKFSESLMKHKYYINNGFFYMIGTHPFFFNPKLIAKILFRQPLDLFLTTSWNDPDVLILVFLKRIKLLKSNIHFWSEANYLTIGARNDNIIKKLLRKFVYNLKGTIQLSSGNMTELTFKKWGVKIEKSIFLPNTIEEEKYILDTKLSFLRRSDDKPIILISARLIERLKGIINFLSALHDDDFLKCKIFIAGNGVDKKQIEDYIRNRGISQCVELKGECTVDEMVKLYSMASVFCLPSFADPSPLSAIEALKMELPLLLSNKCGNHFEAVQSGVNGYIFNPDDHSEIRDAFIKLFDRRSDWASMGKTSLEIYNRVFEKDLVINNFIVSFKKFK